MSNGIKIDPALLKLYNKVKDKKLIYLSLSETMAATIQKNFDTEGHRLGKKMGAIRTKYNCSKVSCSLNLT